MDRGHKQPDSAGPCQEEQPRLCGHPLATELPDPQHPCRPPGESIPVLLRGWQRPLTPCRQEDLPHTARPRAAPQLPPKAGLKGDEREPSGGREPEGACLSVPLQRRNCSRSSFPPYMPPPVMSLLPV